MNGFQLLAAANGADVSFGGGECVQAFCQDRVGAVFEGGGEGRPAGRAGADNEYFGVIGGDDLLIADLRFQPEPGGNALWKAGGGRRFWGGHGFGRGSCFGGGVSRGRRGCFEDIHSCGLRFCGCSLRGRRTGAQQAGSGDAQCAGGCAL